MQTHQIAPPIMIVATTPQAMIDHPAIPFEKACRSSRRRSSVECAISKSDLRPKDRETNKNNAWPGTPTNNETHHLNYSLGDEGNVEDMAIYDSERHFIEVARMKANDPCFIRRSGGKYTFAMVASLNHDAEPFIEFKVSKTGGTKSIPSSHWTTYVFPLKSTQDSSPPTPSPRTRATITGYPHLDPPKQSLNKQHRRRITVTGCSNPVQSPKKVKERRSNHMHRSSSMTDIDQISQPNAVSRSNLRSSMTLMDRASQPDLIETITVVDQTAKPTHRRQSSKPGFRRQSSEPLTSSLVPSSTPDSQSQALPSKNHKTSVRSSTYGRRKSVSFGDVGYCHNKISYPINSGSDFDSSRDNTDSVSFSESNSKDSEVQSVAPPTPASALASPPAQRRQSAKDNGRSLESVSVSRSDSISISESKSEDSDVVAPPKSPLAQSHRSAKCNERSLLSAFASIRR